MSVTFVSHFSLTEIGNFNRGRSYGIAIHIQACVKTYSSCLLAFCIDLYLNNQLRRVCSCLR